MLKISESKPVGKTITLRLEGRIVGPWVEELKNVCEPLVAKNEMVSLDLAEVAFADEAAVSLLTSLHARGINLLNTTPFLEEQLKAEARSASLPQS